MKYLNQGSFNSCAQAAGITYTFAYEINREEDEDGNEDENIYPHHYTWNYLNQGGNNGSWVVTGWNIVRDNGCPNYIDAGHLNNDCVTWLDGYEGYGNGIWNRVNDDGYLFAHYANGLDNIRAWLANHNNQPGFDCGGIGVFMKVFNYAYPYDLLGAGPFTGQRFLTGWPTSGEDHIMTIVGYHDDVNCKSWGYGAFLVANSWGTTFANSGYIWLPYNLAVQEDLIFYILEEVEYRQPAVVAKVKMKHEARNKVRVGIHISQNPFESAPTDFDDYQKKYYAMDTEWHYGGGELPMNGSTDEPLEFEYDISNYIEENFSWQEYPQLKFILGVEEVDSNGEYDGEIIEFSILDYRDDPENPFEVYSHDNFPITIQNNTITNAVVDYFVLPELIESNTSINFNCIVKENSIIASPCTLSFTGPKYLDFYDDGILTIAQGAHLNLQTNAQIQVQRESGMISVLGNLLWGDNINVDYRHSDCYFTLFIENPDLDLNMNNCLQFLGSLETQECNSLTITNSTFINSNIIYKYGDLEIQNNSFLNSNIEALGPNNYNTNRIEITNGNGFLFNQDDISAISIDGYRNFIIDGNIINGYSNGSGIYLTNAGSTSGDKDITYNIIKNCGYDGDYAGIRVFNSNVIIQRNIEISNTSYGIQLYDHSNSMINGNKLANNVYETQYIHDNQYNQILATCQSLPWYCHWNAIVDEDNIDHLFDTENRCSYIDVRWNYWGENFDPASDLVWGCDYEPIWNISPGTRMIYEDEQLYDSACILADSGNYIGSKETLDYLINNFPDSTLASIAIKELFWLEKESTKDFDSLISYYQNNSIIQNDSMLKETATYMIALSEREAQNYDTAIVRFEEIILNPPSFEDSIFAIIDLAYTYQQIPDTSLRSTVGTLSQYKFPFYEQFIISREYHLGLLHGINTAGNGIEVPAENEISNKDIIAYPNPFISSVTFSYTLEKPSTISLEIFNSQGQLVQSNILEQAEGQNEVLWNAETLPPGIYYFKIQAGDKLSSGKLIFLQ